LASYLAQIGLKENGWKSLRKKNLIEKK
jgi:hypothetical protein